MVVTLLHAWLPQIIMLSMQTHAIPTVVLTLKYIWFLFSYLTVTRP